MGKGIALMFKEVFPASFRANEDACNQKGVKFGEMLLAKNHPRSGPRWIINFLTKNRWRHPSKLDWTDSALKQRQETFGGGAGRTISHIRTRAQRFVNLFNLTNC